MSGKYLRKRIPGQPQDPTMTHVNDPWAFKVGDVIRDAYGFDIIVAIDDNVFNVPDIRFAHTIEVDSFPSDAVVHDVRANDEETHRWYRENTIIVR